MAVRLRQVTRQDAKRLALLLGHLGYPVDEGTVQQRLDYWLDDPASFLIGAHEDGDLIGVAALHALPMLEVTGKLGRLLALVVDDSCRSRGVGRLLVEAAEELARAAGCIKMEVTSSRHRVRTHAFYERLGYEDGCVSKARFTKSLLAPEATVTVFDSPIATRTDDRLELNEGGATSVAIWPTPPS